MLFWIIIIYVFSFILILIFFQKLFLCTRKMKPSSPWLTWASGPRKTHKGRCPPSGEAVGGAGLRAPALCVLPAPQVLTPHILTHLGHPDGPACSSPSEPPWASTPPAIQSLCERRALASPLLPRTLLARHSLAFVCSRLQLVKS